MEKRWVIKKQVDAERVNTLASELNNIDASLANLLIQRGVHTYKEAKSFFRPQLEDLQDPFLMMDMEAAVERIQKAVKQGEKILIYGDYDVDGTTSIALLYTFIKEFYSSVDFYVPDRYGEGYGISYKSIDYAEEQGITLVIALDCGIKAVAKIDYAKEKGIDFIICDHHRPGEKLPDACAVLDPKRDDCPYPYKELSGCGVGFKLIQAYASRNNAPFKIEQLNKFLDLVVVSIAADIVPITGENRILAFYGLKVLNEKPRPGIEAILSLNRLQKNGNNYNGKYKPLPEPRTELTINDLVFIIGPRINAAGRIKSGRNSVELLISENIHDAYEHGKTINELNTERKSLDLLATNAALEMIQSDERMLSNKSTIVYDPTWHKGVIGIVASRLIETHYKPTIVLTRSEDLITGSARSVKGFDIYDAVDSCNDLLEHFGGHTYAAGLSLKPENLEEFTKRFEEYTVEHLNKEMEQPEIEIDSELKLKEITNKFFRVLKQFAPFGPGNPSPIFQTNNVVDSGNGRIVGKDGKHLKLAVVQLDISGYPISSIAFQQGENWEYIKDGNSFRICYNIEENEWNGRKSLQLNIKDIMPESVDL